MKKKLSQKDDEFVLGLDFGTLSGRASIYRIQDGCEVAWLVSEYADGVIEEHLPGRSGKLPANTALQNPDDYTAVLKIIPRLLRKAKVSADQVTGIGIDFTSSTVLPVKKDGTSLSSYRKWRNNPHAWVKLWKHHASQPQADLINKIGEKRKEKFLGIYGGKYSSEWFFSKVLETVQCAPEVYKAADRFMEAGDWIVQQLCGQEVRSSSAAGYKAMRVYETRQGKWTFPGKGFFKALDPLMENVISEKVGNEFHLPGQVAGNLTEEWSKVTRLNTGTPVVVAAIDAHAAVPACTVTSPGKLVMILGTSTCHMLLAKKGTPAEGICGVVENGIIPGLWGYEAGQAGVGDVFAWYMNHGVPESVVREAKRLKKSVYQLLEEQAAELAPGEAGLLALDWWNGNRSVLVDADLTGLLLGMDLSTRPHQIYRALIEATAFGTRRIIDAFTEAGIRISELYACGGLAQKNPLLMQIYSDVTGRPIRVADSEQTSALGAAMHAAVAVGAYTSFTQAANAMAKTRNEVYRPDRGHTRIYDELYREYLRLHDQFGRDAKSSMKVLKNIRRRVALDSGGNYA